MKEEIRELLKLMQARVLEALSEIPDEWLHSKPTSASTSSRHPFRSRRL